MTTDQKNRIYLYQVNRKSKFARGLTGWVCPIWWTKADEMRAVTESHHRLSNTKTNQKLYPLVVDSMLSRLPVEGGMHKQYPSFATIRPLEAEKMQRFLERHLAYSDFVNGKTERLWG